MAKTSENIPRPPLSPLHWPAWLGLGLLRLMLLLPFPLLVLIGRGLGRGIYYLAWRWRFYTYLNLRRCFPDKPRREHGRLAKAHFEAVGIGIFELGLGWWASDRRLRRLVTVEGLEHLEAAQAQGKGVLIMSAHFTSFEIGGRLLGLFTPFHLMYRPNRNPVLEYVVQRSRRRHFDGIIPSNNIRTLMRRLREGHCVWYAPDLAYTKQNHVWVPFFGRPAPTNTATSRIARATDSPVVPFYPERLPGGRGYCLHLLPALEDFPSDDPEADTVRTNAVLEEQIRKVPEQYFWSFDRFKTRLHKRWRRARFLAGRR
ncbi:lysophospholipid acyltransferase family protein [Natronospira bacteriovora]|uniref:Lipid A biosynthesis acyltransferase n=1 Tax=Natronospira bacteriovora TaxID=3069753 RepID=A0ABU0W6Q4_9GAMM|nr:lipid A biosynthesis acyltransferase [Natronospira sp. AB-CW4]MDQ2069614.1 lipid A biosynthesis acyltransferase [Natronospira sp. AB-CW4]